MCNQNKGFIPSGHIDWFNNPIPSPDAFEEGNMANISPTVKIDISIKPGIVEEITIGAACSPEELIAYKALFQEYRDIFSWSYMEMPKPRSFYRRTSHRHMARYHPCTTKENPLHPSKEVAIKAKIDKLHTAGFIYPITYTSWVSNPSLSTTNRELFMYVPTFSISITLVPKTTSQRLSSTKISMTVPTMRPCPSWMGSLATIKSRFIQQISIRPHSLPHGVIFLIVSCLSD
jgi:hypothetical protein